MIVTSTEFVPEKKIVKSFGIARGNSIRARHVGKDIIAALKTLVGGEIEEYTKLIAESREQALERMMEEGRKMGANAVINVRFTTSAVMANAAEILAYGTAVLVEE